jgi:hypothetical protein
MDYIFAILLSIIFILIVSYVLYIRYNHVAMIKKIGVYNFRKNISNKFNDYVKELFSNSSNAYET